MQSERLLFTILLNNSFGFVTRRPDKVYRAFRGIQSHWCRLSWFVISGIQKADTQKSKMSGKKRPNIVIHLFSKIVLSGTIVFIELAITKAWHQCFTIGDKIIFVGFPAYPNA